MTLLLGEFLLPLRELFQLLHRVVDLPLLGIRRLLPLPRALVLILFGIELEVEKALHIAGRPTAASATAASALAAKSHLDIAERRFGVQEILQRFLLRRQRVAQR